MLKNKINFDVLGIDKPLILFFISKGFSLLAAPISILLISSKLNSYEQGYYFTFSSLLGISVFFELGLGVVITQFCSHEFGKLEWTHDRDLVGDDIAKHRILGLVRKSLFWYFVMSLTMALIIIPVGLYTLGSANSSLTINYIFPWVLLIIVFSLNTALIPFIAFLEGSGRVAEVQKIRIFQTLIVIPITWGVLFFNGKLFVFFIEYFGYFSIISLWILIRYKQIIYQIVKFEYLLDISISWSKEIFPMQWKIALSWLSAYFINYMFVPLLFHFQNPEVAGKMGMSLKLSGYIYIIGMAWINTKSPQYGSLISSNQQNKLERIFKQATLNALFVSLLISIVLICSINIYRIYNPAFESRILPISLLSLLCLANVINIFNSSIASYLRAFKKEPLLYVSLFLAILIAISNLISANFFDENLMVINYFIILLVFGVGAHLYIFKRNNLNQ